MTDAFIIIALVAVGAIVIAASMGKRGTRRSGYDSSAVWYSDSGSSYSGDSGYSDSGGGFSCGDGGGGGFSGGGDGGGGSSC
ncbi:hypothetical protein MOQ72_31540 [Saccharopolyspora sp. K220]|uniref:hypothetical protein n=1 Tax=Saccharopolyspora soli TaxID=2926618 RepID=UPI001F561297|nr:hypothetical protein [Saccharopolyspora soli]MCI2421977.1 hypothetical protein [Saccharopolyspora soli]